MQRSEDGCDMRRFRSFNHSTWKTPQTLMVQQCKWGRQALDSHRWRIFVAQASQAWWPVSSSQSLSLGSLYTNHSITSTGIDHRVDRGTCPQFLKKLFAWFDANTRLYMCELLVWLCVAFQSVFKVKVLYVFIYWLWSDVPSNYTTMIIILLVIIS